MPEPDADWTPPLQFPAIIARYAQRKADAGLLHQMLVEVQRAVDGDIQVVLPELDANEKPAVANLIALGLNQLSQRVASTMPNVSCPAVEPGKATGLRSEEYARIRRMAYLSWLQDNKLPRKNRRKARYFLAYGSAPTMIIPDFKKKAPKWVIRDPLSTYPAAMDDPDDVTPDDVIFSYMRTYSWLKTNWPIQAESLKNMGLVDNSQVEMIEFVDSEQWTLGVIATRASNRGGAKAFGVGEQPQNMIAPIASDPNNVLIHLRSIPNRAKIPLAVVPSQIALNRKAGYFAQSIGMYQSQAKLTALELIAVEKGVFPDLAIISADGQVATVNGEQGKWEDGRTGIANVVSNAKSVQWLQMNPGNMTTNAIDRLERAMRVTSSIPAEFSGESPSNIRTGRRGEAVLSAAVDFLIQESQEILAESLAEEIRRAHAVQKGYFANDAKSYYVTFGKAKGHVDYTAAKHFETDAVRVSYSLPGADANALAIAGGQRVGMGTLSKRSFMRIDPYVEDDEYEWDQVVNEGIHAAVLESFQQQAAQGAIPVSDAARVAELVATNKMDLYAAILQAQEEAQERQASQVPPDSPEAQPGLAVPGAGAEAGLAIQPPNPNQGNLAQLLTRLRQPAMRLDIERPQ